MDDHVRDRHHYELTAWHRTKGALDDRCKIDLFDGGEPLIRDRNKRRFRPFRREWMIDVTHACWVGRSCA
jgi:hypothetical protein